MSARSPYLVAAVLAVCGWSAVAAAADVRAATVATASESGLGKVLVSSSGRTLYETSATGTAAACTGSCALRWHPLVVGAGAKPIAGAGVKPALLGTRKRADGRLQVTYDGRRLYLFTGDTKGGSAAGQGLGGVWHAIAPGGQAVLSPAAAQASGSSTSMPSGSESPTTAPATATTAPGASTTPGSVANPGMWCAANPKSCVNGVPVAPPSG